MLVNVVVGVVIGIVGVVFVVVVVDVAGVDIVVLGIVVVGVVVVGVVVVGVVVVVFDFVCSSSSFLRWSSSSGLRCMFVVRRRLRLFRRRRGRCLRRGRRGRRVCHRCCPDWCIIIRTFTYEGETNCVLAYSVVGPCSFGISCAKTTGRCRLTA